MTGHERADGPAPARRTLPTEARECKAHAEDPARTDTERLVWAVLAVAAELHAVHKTLRKG
ncbi:hypothetical protein [Streptomyces sp. NPDC088789]|uniref:hypothetical protein n=1 Tax=Streptomyces sp. NPDC088789 TaxID=3365899 RepID=UPI003825BD28